MMSVDKNKSFVKMKKMKARLSQSRKSQKLNFSCLDLSQLPDDFMSLIKAAGVTTVTEIDMHRNGLSDLPSEIEKFNTVKVLKLNGNRFHKLPDPVFYFSKLQVLDVSENNLKEMDENLRCFVYLRELNYSKNQLTSLPSFWGQFGVLVSVNISKNKLIELPEAIGSLRSLQRLDASENILSSLPKSMLDLEELTHLDLHGNQFAEIPSWLGISKSLCHLDCGDNPLIEATKSIYSEGFEKFVDHLRNLYEQQQLNALIQKKPEASTIGGYRSYSTRTESGQAPTIRNGHSITQCGPVTYIFGGRINNYGKVDEVYAIDSRTLLWVRVATSGSIPTARDGHATAFDGHKRLFIFGGRNEENKLLNDIFYLDLKTMSWFQPPVEGNAPSIREGASMAVIGSQIILFGGCGSRQRYNDVYVLCLQTWAWMLRETKGSMPAPRQNAAIGILGTRLYIHGGRGSLMLDDLHVLDTVSFTWSRVSQRGFGPSPRFFHGACVYEKKFFVVGGLNVKGEPLNSIFVLPLNDKKNDDSEALEVLDEERRGSWYPSDNTWVELELEVSLSVHSTFCFNKDKLVIIKEGKDFKKDDNNSLPLWEVYMEAPLDTFKIKASEKEIERPMDNKTARVHYTMQTKMPELPQSYQLQTDKEKRLLNHISQFQKRFMQLYPQRRPLMMVVRNECGIEKFVCTTIRPSHMDFIELYNWEGCAEFLANFLTYEKLEEPTRFPSYLPSPQSVLEWQRGDCFDFSIALVSLLTGAGYDAFCVVGYAPSCITTNNQTGSMAPKPIAVREHKLLLDTSNAPTVATENNKYVKESPPFLNSECLLREKEARDKIVEKFVQEFKSNYDRKLQPGQTEEEDSLLTFCTAKCPMQTTGEELTSLEQNISQDSESLICTEKESLAPFPGNTQSATVEVNDNIYKNRLHCWVLVSKGKRDEPESFFLEPSTGRRYPILESPYHAVEYIWNQHNLWINMQPNPERSGLAEVSWDLRDTSRWERVLDNLYSNGYIQDKNHVLTAQGTESSSFVSGQTTGRGPESTTSGASEIEENHSGSGKETEAISYNSDTDKNGLKIPISPRSKLGIEKGRPEDEQHKGYMDPHHWLLPASWVPKLRISVESFVTRCPNGVKKTQYHKCTHELYAFYGDFVRWDGLIEKLLIYADEEHSILLECHDYFQRRKDCLRKRIFYLIENKIHHFFSLGASFGLMEIEIKDGQSRVFRFYPDSRNDGLLSRQEVIGKKLVETFKNHEKGLIYRCATYGLPSPEVQENPSPRLLSDRYNENITLRNMEIGAKGTISRPGSVIKETCRTMSRGMSIVGERSRSKSRARALSKWRGGASNRSVTSTPGLEKITEKNLNGQSQTRRRTITETLLPIVKITQKYEATQGASQFNVAKHVFKISMGQIRVDYQNIYRHITATSRLYNKDGSLTVLQVDPFESELEMFSQMDEYHELTVAEHESIKAVRDAEREIQSILQRRLHDEQNVILETPFIDVAFVKQDEILQETEGVVKVHSDYLCQFLPLGVRPRQKLTRQQMLLVRDNCLKALKERLVNRAMIIQAHYDEETTTLAKRRANFERDKEQMSVEDEEEYNQACENALFRIRILELRAKEHEGHALQKYKEMEKRLRSDSRLAPLYEGGL